MKTLYTLLGLLISLTLASCYEEDTLTPTEGGVELRFNVPQGSNSWDTYFAEIYDEYSVYFIYKDLQREDFNRGWIDSGSPLSDGVQGGGCPNDEMTKFYEEFLRKHIFAYINSAVTKKVLPIYWYLSYNAYTINKFELMPGWVFTSNVPANEITDGLDFWSTCMFGVDTPDEPYVTPTNQSIFGQRRKMIIGNILSQAVKKKNIAIPQDFSNGLDYKTELINSTGGKDNANYYLTRAFPGSVRLGKFLLDETDNNSNPPNEEDTFIGYILQSMYFTEAESLVEFPATKYPLLAEKFALVRKHLKDKYQIDLNAIAEGPEDWDVTLPPYGEEEEE